MEQRIQILFKRYQEGTATAAERKLVETWFESHYGQQGRKLSRNEEASVFEDLDSRMTAMLAEEVKVRKLNFRWLRVAALLMAILATGLVVRNRLFRKNTKPETFTEIKSLLGVKKEVTLADGTTIFMNSGSTVYVSSRFGETNRTVKLVGEAFFQVKHNARKPFIIQSGKLKTTVLGTSFDIKAYPEDEHMRISVATGRVKVEGQTGSAKPTLYARGLIHNQALVYSKSGDSHEVTTVNTDSISSWRSNHLIFENASMEEIAVMIARWYNLDVKLSHTAADPKRYTLSFYNERADKVLDVISRLSGMTYNMQGRTVLIKPRKS